MYTVPSCLCTTDLYTCTPQTFIMYNYNLYNKY